MEIVKIEDYVDVFSLIVVITVSVAENGTVKYAEAVIAPFLIYVIALYVNVKDVIVTDAIVMVVLIEFI